MWYIFEKRTKRFKQQALIDILEGLLGSEPESSAENKSKEADSID